MLPFFADANFIRMAIMLAGTTIATVTDVRGRRIPNAVTVPIAMAGLGIGAVSGGVSGLATATSGLLMGILFFLFPVAKLGWGMGDLKLAAALGTLGGPLFVLWLGLYAMITGGLFALVYLKQQGQLAHVASGMQGDLRIRKVPLARSGLSIPFAIPIAAGMVVALFVFPGLH